MVNSIFESVLAELETLGVVSGLHTTHEKRLLHELASSVSLGSIVEIGSFLGYSTIILAKALNQRGTVYAIDPHTGKPCEDDEREFLFGDTWAQFNANIQQAGVSHIVRSLKMRAEEAVKGWEKPIGVLWIDGSHRHEDVKKDFLLWQPYVVKGGVVVFHDIWTPGVRKVIANHFLRDSTFDEFRFAPCCMLCATKLGHKHPKVHVWRTALRLALGLASATEGRRTLRRLLARILRWV